MTEDTYSIVLLKNVDTTTHKLTHDQVRKLRETIDSFPDSQDGLIIKLAFADAFIDALPQIDATK